MTQFFFSSPCRVLWVGRWPTDSVLLAFQLPFYGRVESWGCVFCSWLLYFCCCCFGFVPAWLCNIIGTFFFFFSWATTTPNFQMFMSFKKKQRNFVVFFWLYLSDMRVSWVFAQVLDNTRLAAVCLIVFYILLSAVQLRCRYRGCPVCMYCIRTVKVDQKKIKNNKKSFPWASWVNSSHIYPKPRPMLPPFSSVQPCSSWAAAAKRTEISVPGYLPFFLCFFFFLTQGVFPSWCIQFFFFF